FVTPGNVFTQLHLLKRWLQAAASGGSANDVIVVYFQGREAVDKNGHFLLSSIDDPDFRVSGVAFDQLTRLFGEMPGGQVLLLDVAHQKSGEENKVNDLVTQWPDQPNVGVVRYSRRRPVAPQLLDDLQAQLTHVKRLADAVELLRKKLIWDSESAAFVDP